MGDAGRERADRRQPVGEDELRLESPLLRLGALSIADVPVHRHEARHLTGGVPDGHRGDLDVDRRPVVSRVADLHRAAARPLDLLLDPA